MYSVYFAPGTKRGDVFKVKTLCYCIVSWEKPHVRDEPVQCFNCLKFHHIAANCKRKARCAKCSGEHSIDTCEVETNACANCNEAHQADSKECKVYTQVLETRKKRQTSRVPSSLPTRPTEPMTNPTETPWSNLFSSQPSTSQQRSYSTPTQQQNIRTAASENPQNKESQKEENLSLGTMLADLKSLFNGLNLPKILVCIKILLGRLKKAKDGFSKLTIILETVFEFFDG